MTSPHRQNDHLSNSPPYCLRSRFQKRIHILPSKSTRSRSVSSSARTSFSEERPHFWNSRTKSRKRHPSSSCEKENRSGRRKRVRFHKIRRVQRCSQDLNLHANRFTPCCLTPSPVRTRIVDLKKRKAFLDRIRAQEPDIEQGCVIRSSESDDVLVKEHKATLSTQTLTQNQDEIVSISRLADSFIGRGGFGEVSAWQIMTKDHKILRVAVKGFDPLDGGFKLAQAEAAVMVEFEQLLDTKILLWFVPRKLKFLPNDFPCPAIIMPLYENRKCLSPSLFNLVFEKKLMQPTLTWIIHVAKKVLEILVKLHTAGWAHGDVHCGNVMITNREVVLIDFSKANKKNRPYVYCLAKTTNWVQQLDWIEPNAVTGQSCCSRASDIWSFGKLIQVLVEAGNFFPPLLNIKDGEHHFRLSEVVHLCYHRRQFRPDAKFLLDLLNSKDLSSVDTCSCLPSCEMLQT